jgi:transcriptional regulator with XRE-family HTH domain
VSALSDALNEANVNGWSGREIARRMDNHPVHYGTVAAYLKGNHGKKPRENVLLGFSEALKVPVTRLREAAGLPPGQDESMAPAAEWRRLDRRQQRVVNEMIRMLAEPRVVQGDSEREAVSKGERSFADGREPQERARQELQELPTAARKNVGERGNPDVNRAGEEAEGSQDPGGDEPS